MGNSPTTAVPSRKLGDHGLRTQRQRKGALIEAHHPEMFGLGPKQQANAVTHPKFEFATDFLCDLTKLTTEGAHHDRCAPIWALQPAIDLKARFGEDAPLVKDGFLGRQPPQSLPCGHWRAVRLRPSLESWSRQATKAKAAAR